MDGLKFNQESVMNRLDLHANMFVTDAQCGMGAASFMSNLISIRITGLVRQDM